MALKFMACTIRASNPDFADLILELWYEFEEGKTPVAQLVQQIDALECLHQAVLYAERTGIDLDDFMTQKEEVTHPELMPLLDVCLARYEELKRRKQSEIVVIFVSGI
jgi:5'-deoxynucleotidase YfbR-like HD superfamily hydrolase